MVPLQKLIQHSHSKQQATRTFDVKGVAYRERFVFRWWEKIDDRYTFKIDVVGSHGEMEVSCLWVVGEDR